MAKRIRVYELARELGVDSKDLIANLNEMGMQIKNHMAALDDEVCQRIRRNMPAAKSRSETKQKTVRTMTGKDDLQEKQVAGNKPESKQSPQGVSRKPERQAPVDHSARNRAKEQDNRRQSTRHRGSRPGQKSFGQRRSFKSRDRHKSKQDRPATGARRVVIQGDTPVRELASLVGVPVSNILRTLMSLGALISINQNVPPDLARKVSEKFGCVVTVKEPEKTIEEKIALELDRPDDPEKAAPRPPVITVMGHVDHGKTSLLDAIRNTNITAREAGGITQHIGASLVEHENNRLIFLDTPGHEAFTHMRARGAKITDLAVLVVAADDGIMPQTVEAANHAKAAEVPIIVAINKMDKPGARPERVKQQLTEIGLVSEEWGGDTVVVEVSAKTRQGIDELLEMISLVAEMQELKADPTRRARGYIIESQMDKGRGPVAAAIIKSGVLRVGHVIITDTTWGRIRAMYDGRGRQVEKAGPSTPVEVVGLEELPQAGDTFLVVADEKTAKQVIEKRRLQKREQEFESTRRMTLEELLKAQEEEEIRELRLIIKSDVQGSLEAILQALGKMKTGEVKLEILHSGVGAVIESDIMLAKASDAKILGFNVRPDANARNVAESENIEIRSYRIIYELLEDVEKMLKGLVKPKFEEVMLGRAEVRATFHVPNTGTVAGSYVVSGKVTRNAGVRLVRDGRVVYEGKISSLRRFKDDVSEVSQGYECGIGLERFQDIKPGDVIEAFAMKEVKPA
ncbi:MAG TPA: translation initiation factor IF-2 [Firmicutes bacterium]|jgi:translation initiation factor IF-2|nr:translation initiation factor IF-2 [Bacillota bacterium]